MPLHLNLIDYLSGRGNTSGNYARKHNPMVNWQDTYGATSNDIPAADNQPFSSFPSSDFSALPTVSFVIPNLNDDMHNGTIAQGDTWLQNNLSAYATWAQTHNSLLVITWDEDDGSENNQIPTIFVGQDIQAGQYSEPINHYTVLRTIEDMYGLSYAGNSADVSPITDIWTTQPPAAPTNVSATAGDAQVTLSWAASSGATSYNIYRSTSTGAESLYETGITGTSFTDTAVTNGTPYFYQVTAVNFAGESDPSDEVSATPQSTIIADGVYEIVNLKSGLVLDDPGSSTTRGTQMDQAINTQDSNQQWNIQSVGGGYYTITNQASGMVLDDRRNSTTAGTKIIQWPANGGDNQLWFFQAEANGTFEIVNKRSGLVLDIRGGSTASGAPAIQWTDHQGANQEWTLQPIGSAAVPDGTYYLSNLNSGLVMDDPRSSMTAGMQMIQWPLDGRTGHPNQHWVIQSVGDGYYTITNASSQLLLTETSTEDSAPVVQEPFSGAPTDYQLWSFVAQPYGGYAIYNKATGNILDVSGGSTSARARLTTDPFQGTTSELWNLTLLAK